MFLKHLKLIKLLTQLENLKYIVLFTCYLCPGVEDQKKNQQII